jgi:branched-chain amino acid transport system ATP-binding protein
MTESIALRVAGLVAGYQRFNVLQDISLEVAPGSALAVLGPNGAGKSTLLRTVMGQVRPRGGDVVIGGVSVAGWPAHKVARGYAAIVPEGRRLFVNQSVEDNLRLGGFHLRKDTARVVSLLDTVYTVFPKLVQYRARDAGALSGGEQQMVAIGRAMMADPQVLLLDEPSLGLAPLAVAEVVKGLVALREAGRALLLVEQRVDLALQVVNRVCILNRGTLAVERDAAELDESGAEQLVAAYLD